MLTPVDIHNKEFSRSFRGFNQEEVDDFLDQVVNDYEMLYRDNHQMKKEIELCNKQLDQYHQLEKNLQDTLLVAQRTADEVVNTANIRGEEVRQAARQAGGIVQGNPWLEQSHNLHRHPPLKRAGCSEK